MSETSTHADLPIVREIGESLLAASMRAERPLKTQRRRRRRLPHSVMIPVVLLAILALTAAALAAGGVIGIGSPAKPSGALSKPNTGLGVPLPGTVRLLPNRTADPAGGPAWGMRLMGTTRGVGCLQVGRVLDGRLGVLGQDGVFGDDGRFHEVPVRGYQGPPTGCGSLDAHGHLFTTALSIDVPASGWNGDGSCSPPLWTRGAPKSQLCPERDERTLYFGVLGPQASAVTYELNGQRLTAPTQGSDGAYLIVARAEGLDEHGDYTTDGQGALLNSPITELHYRDGSACRVEHPQPPPIPRRSPEGPKICPAVGYAAPSSKPLTVAQVVAPIHTRVFRSTHGRRYLEISFTSRVAVTNARSAYTITFHPPGRPGRFGNEFALGSTQSDIRAGQTIRRRYPASRGGLYRGSVTYVRSIAVNSAMVPFLAGGPGTESAVVGRFEIRLR